MVRTSLVVGLVVLLAGALCAGSVYAAVKAGEEDSVRTVSVGDARAAMTAIVAATPDLRRPHVGKRFCEQWSDDRSMCERSLEESDLDAFPMRDVEIVNAVGTDDERSVVVSVTGTTTSGEAFDTDVEFVRSSDGSVRAVDPIYWNGRSISVL